jgi:segregation and condensation protein A
VWSLAEARVALEKLVGQSLDWSPLDQYLVAYLVEPAMIPTVLASTFAAALELVREGHLEAHQQGAFTPLYLRKRQGGRGDEAAAGDVTGGGGSPGGVPAESGNA